MLGVQQTTEKRERENTSLTRGHPGRSMRHRRHARFSFSFSSSSFPFYRTARLRRSGVGAAYGGRHGPVVLCDARPEDPNHDDGEQGEESREEAAVDGAAGAGADVHADHVLEDLADGEKESGDAQVD